MSKGWRRKVAGPTALMILALTAVMIVGDVLAISALSESQSPSWFGWTSLGISSFFLLLFVTILALKQKPRR